MAPAMTDAASLTTEPLQRFLDRLASADGTPGGGSAAALIGAMAAALVSMVGNLTVGRPRFADVEPRMRSLLAEAERLRAELERLVAADVAAFEALMQAWRLRREDADRPAAIQRALRRATEVPLACAEAAAAVIALCRPAATHGNPNVLSDAGVAAVAARAALEAAALNVRINLGALEDRAFAEQAGRRLQALLDAAGSEAAAVYEAVARRLEAGGEG